MYIEVQESAVLAYQTTKPLVVPDDAFNSDGIATIVVTGSAYGGMWVLNALSAHSLRDQATIIGALETSYAPERPDLAVEAAEAWVKEECERLCLKVAHVASQNRMYGSVEAPFFASILFDIDRRK